MNGVLFKDSERGQGIAVFYCIFAYVVMWPLQRNVLEA